MKKLKDVLNVIQESGNNKYRLIEGCSANNVTCSNCCFFDEGAYDDCKIPDDLHDCIYFADCNSGNFIYEKI